MPLLKVQSQKVKYSDDAIESVYDYETTEIVQSSEQELIVKPIVKRYNFKTARKVPKLGYVFFKPQLLLCTFFGLCGRLRVAPRDPSIATILLHTTNTQYICYDFLLIL